MINDQEGYLLDSTTHQILWSLWQFDLKAKPTDWASVRRYVAAKPAGLLWAYSRASGWIAAPMPGFWGLSRMQMCRLSQTRPLRVVSG